MTAPLINLKDMDLSLTSTSELIAYHNDLLSKLGRKDLPLRSWKKSKKDLLEIIIPMDVEYGIKVAAEEAEKAARVEATKNHASANTIRDAALALLCQVAYYEDKTKKPSPDNRVDPSNKLARSVGLPYQSIVNTLLAQFPGAKTSLACLRWYCVKVRVNEHGFTGYTLPQRRPRAGQN